MPWQVMIAWTETSDVKLKFLGIIEIFEAWGSLIYCSCGADWLSRSSIWINFKSRCILCEVYSTHFFTIIHVDTDTFQGSKGDFPITCVVASFKIRSHYIKANLTLVVYAAEVPRTLSSEKSSATLSHFNFALYTHTHTQTHTHTHTPTHTHTHTHT